jgi:hypothetical protein
MRATWRSTVRNAEEQCPGDLSLRLAGRDELHHVELAIGQAEGV